MTRTPVAALMIVTGFALAGCDKNGQRTPSAPPGPKMSAADAAPAQSKPPLVPKSSPPGSTLHTPPPDTARNTGAAK
jgi:hypothetical protein